MPPKITVGDKEQVFSATVIAENNELISMDAELSQPGVDNKHIVKLEAIFTIGGGTQSSGSFVSTEQGVRFTFVDWNNSLGTSTTAPMKFGNFGPRKMYLSVANHHLGGSNLCTFAILLGD